MSKRTRFLAASLLSGLSISSLAACNGSTSITSVGPTADSGGAGVGGSSGGANATSGVGTGGITTGGGGTSVGTGGTVATTSAGGTTSSAGGIGGTTASAGGAGGTTSSAGGIGGTTTSTGGKASTSTGGKASTSTGGKTSTSAGGTTTSAGGTTSNAGGTTSNAGGTTSSTGGKASTSTGGKTSTSAGGTTSSTGGTTSSAGGTTGDVKCTLPTLPDASALPVNKKLPDPFTFFDGTKVTTKAQWECRRQEILAMAAKYIYNPVPGKPDSVTGTVSGSAVSMTVKVGSKSDTFSATISGSGKAIALELQMGFFPSSHKTLTFGSGFEGKIKTLYGFTSDVNTNIANGWMIDRVMDVLEQNPSSGHDPTKVMVSGCSGCGKGAYLAGVFSRAPLVIIVESGGGGAANLRQAEWFRHGGGTWNCADDKPQSIDNLESNGICGPWITSTANWLVSAPSKVNNLPFDTHSLLATIAPRYLLHFSNYNGVNSWCHLGGTCEALSAWAAKPVWKALGIPERMGFHMYNAGHCSQPTEAVNLANEFFKRAIDGDTSAKTDVMDIQSSGVQQPVADWPGMWIDWDMNTVLQ
jgi:hypothetical protein